mgnify:CR=1 FL=1
MMAATNEMITLAERLKPHAACLVPEKREERTTEGGLDVRGRFDATRMIVARLQSAGMRVSLFINPDLKQVEGAFALTVLTEEGLIACRDPLGIRPLVMGKLGEATIFASESVALDVIGATFIREVEPGELVVVNGSGLRSFRPFAKASPRPCIFEHVYFSRPDSIVDGSSVYSVRKQIGAKRYRSSFIYRCKAGCRSKQNQYNNMHTKFYSFSQAGRSKDVLAVGSANMTERSMSLDSELCLIWQADAGSRLAAPISRWLMMPFSTPPLTCRSATGSPPCSAIFFFTSASFSTLISAALSFETTGAGVLAGANMPNQEVAS